MTEKERHHYKREVEELILGDVLERIEEHRLDQSEGAILVCCGDADRVFEKVTFHASTQLGYREEPRIHLVAVNGGPLGIPHHSPVNSAGETLGADAYLLRQIRGARNLKGINTVVLCAHAPCGMADLAGLNVFQIVELLIAAKRRVREEHPDGRVAPFLHVDYGAGIMRTYFVPRPAWEAWHSAYGATRKAHSALL